jgi:hypothetical protein
MGSGLWTIAIAGIMLIAAWVLLRSLFLPARTAVTGRPGLLNEAERRLYQALQVWSGERWTIFCKVSLVDLLAPKSSAKQRRNWYQALAGHRVDFVLCDPLSTKVEIAIHLESPAGESEANEIAARREFLSYWLKQAGIDLVSIPVKPRYSADEIQHAINA